MGKTAPSDRMALEWEIDKWRCFRNALASEEEREAFDEADRYVQEICLGKQLRH